MLTSSILPEDGRAAGRAAHHALITAVWPAKQPTRRWLVLADESDIANSLEADARRGRRHGHDRTPGDMASGNDLGGGPATAGLVARARGIAGSADSVEIVYLGALDSGEGEEAAPDLSSSRLPLPSFRQLQLPRPGESGW